jgi:hypothetical protein
MSPEQMAQELIDACSVYNADRTIRWFDQEELRRRLVELFKQEEIHEKSLGDVVHEVRLDAGGAQGQRMPGISPRPSVDQAAAG